jgi:toxin ParE1/3/4
VRTKPIVTRKAADEDVDRAFEYYLSEGGPDVAAAFIDEYERATSHLSRFPLSGSPRPGHTLLVQDLRQWPLNHFPYLIFYFDRENFVEIWRVLHGGMDFPRRMLEDK